MALLEFLNRSNWPHAPKVLAVNEGVATLSFVEGDAAITDDAKEAASADTPLLELAAIVRQLHDLTEGTALADGEQVACHNDLDPRNTIYRTDADGAIYPVALIDWDLAGAGQPVHDLAHICWTHTRLGPKAEVDEVSHRIDVILRGYRWTGTRDEVVDTMLWWQDRCWRGIHAEASAGDPAMVRARQDRVVEAVRAQFDWTREHLAAR
ncbi:MAG TPA: phosphotransferase [Ornithinicoccus sp.]|nr:phosphotransferase [Ornithinicoccus sp.]